MQQQQQKIGTRKYGRSRVVDRSFVSCHIYIYHLSLQSINAFNEIAFGIETKQQQKLHEKIKLISVFT